MNIKNKTTLAIASLGFAAFATNASAATTVLPTSSDATFFSVSATDNRINDGLNRIGFNAGAATEFMTFVTFDVTGLTADLNAATSITLDFALTAFDNTPVLDDLVVEYIGTFADNTFGVGGVNGANANAIAMSTAAAVNTVFSGAPGVGALSVDATAIGSDTFANQYATFRITDPSAAAHQWDIADATPTLTIVSPVPEPSSTALLGLGGLALVLRRRK